MSMTPEQMPATVRHGPLSGRFTRNGWLTATGAGVVAGLGAAFLIAAAFRWSDIGTDFVTAVLGQRAAGTILGVADAPPGAPETAYVVTVEFAAGAAGLRRVSRQLVSPTGAGVEGGSRLRLDRPVTVSYRADAPDHAVLWTLQEPWTAVWTVPVGLALIGVAWGLRPRT
jgi:hypothetical protein